MDTRFSPKQAAAATFLPADQTAWFLRERFGCAGDLCTCAPQDLSRGYAFAVAVPSGGGPDVAGGDARRECGGVRVRGRADSKGRATGKIGGGAPAGRVSGERAHFERFKVTAPFFR